MSDEIGVSLTTSKIGGTEFPTGHKLRPLPYVYSLYYIIKQKRDRNVAYP